MQLERLAYWATLSRQLKDNQDIYKRFLFHYSRTQKPTQPVKSGIPPVHPLMRLAAQLEDRRVKRFPQQRDSGTATVDFTKKVWKPCGEVLGDGQSCHPFRSFLERTGLTVCP
ncbi:neuromedin-S isoform X1 [Leptonychotes weddellii]|uniref:Neuromedin-S isoform X1 n=1 Tax=Leptonychotes weddellii TaxID=9713 RepID=A0A7F8QXR4_LEPWE|nr:neuromedin-S isoform X1 [Leptonychotes weddellii]